MGVVDRLRDGTNGIASTSDFAQLKYVDRKTAAKKIAYFLLALGIAILFFFPFYWLLKVSLTWPPRTISQGVSSLWIEDPNIFNFIKVYYSLDYFQFFLNSLIITAIATTFGLLNNSLAAYALTLEFYGKKWVQLFLIAAMMIPYYLTVIPAYLITSRLGLLDTRIGVALLLSVMVIGILVLEDSFRSIPDGLVDSARLDGASELYILFGIYFPLSKAAIATNVILLFTVSWNAYLWPAIVISDRAVQPLSLSLVVFQYDLRGQFVLMYAFAVMVLVPIFIVFVLLQRQFIQSITLSTLKE